MLLGWTRTLCRALFTAVYTKPFSVLVSTCRCLSPTSTRTFLASDERDRRTPGQERARHERGGAVEEYLVAVGGVGRGVEAELAGQVVDGDVQLHGDDGG